MKFQTLALAAALSFGGAAFAAPNDTAKAPVTTKTTHAAHVKHHVMHASRHTKHHMKQMAKRHHMDHGTASTKTDVDSGSRQDRMDAALRKFRTTHS